MTYSTTAQKKINATGADELPVLLLEIDHPTFTQPVRVVNDGLDLTSNGELYVAMRVEASLPDQQPGQMPRARLALDNVGRELVEPLEASNGGEGATVRMMQVLRSTPNVIEWEATLDLSNVEMSSMTVTGDLSYEDILNKPGVPMRYDPVTAPGLF